MYFEHYGGHYAVSRHQELLAEAEQARLRRLARAAHAPPASSAAAKRVACAGTRRLALWLGTRLVRWGEALQVRALPPDATPEASTPW